MSCNIPCPRLQALGKPCDKGENHKGAHRVNDIHSNPVKWHRDFSAKRLVTNFARS